MKLMELYTDVGEKDKLILNLKQLVNQMIEQDVRSKRLEIGVNLIGAVKNAILRKSNGQ